MDSNIKYDWISLKKSVKAYLKSLFLADIYNVTWIVYYYIHNSFLSKMLVWVKFQNIAISSRGLNFISNCPYMEYLFIILVSNWSVSYTYQ